MQLQEITRWLNEWAPLSYQESYDNAGLITGHLSLQINGVLCTLDCTAEVVEEAIEKKCNLIIVHHPILFKGLKSLAAEGYVERALVKAIKNDIAIYAIHTNLDHVAHGVNKGLGEKLGLTDLEILAPKSGLLKKLVTFVPEHHAEGIRNALFEAGAGHIGAYDRCSFNLNGVGTFRGSEGTNPFVGKPGIDHHEPETRIEMVFPAPIETRVLNALRSAHPYEEPAVDLYMLENKIATVGSGMIGSLPKALETRDFLNLLCSCLGLSVVRHTEGMRRSIERVAICGGAGSFLLNDATRNGADAFVTSDFKYHEFFDADRKILVCDVGHYESEQFTPELIRDFLVQKNITFAVLLSEVRTNPVHYHIP